MKQKGAFFKGGHEQHKKEQQRRYGDRFNPRESLNWVGWRWGWPYQSHPEHYNYLVKSLASQEFEEAPGHAASFPAGRESWPSPFRPILDIR